MSFRHRPVLIAATTALPLLLAGAAVAQEPSAGPELSAPAAPGQLNSGEPRIADPDGAAPDLDLPAGSAVELPEEAERAMAGDDPCAVDPSAPETDADETAGAEGEALAETLDTCDGVLKPVPQGDAAIVEPAPDQGRTPVIPPEALPGDPQ